MIESLSLTALTFSDTVPVGLVQPPTTPRCAGTAITWGCRASTVRKPTATVNRTLRRREQLPMPDVPGQPGRRRRRRERVFRMSSQALLEAAQRELHEYGLHAFTVRRRSTPGWLLLVVNVEDGAAASVAVRVVLSVDRQAEQLAPLD